ncbi:MAG: YciI family protein [Nitrospira sp. LK70]|nr:YciI family protein [Nitrospira sp. LK70]
MKYLLLVYHNEEAFNQIPEGHRKDMLAESIQLCHQLDGKGQYVHASPLQPEATGILVRVRNGKAMVTDGPFAEAKEQLAGYFLIEAKDRDDAARIAKLVPGARIGTVEVRPLREVTGLPGEEKQPSAGFLSR